jgi:hypothetical protein
MKEILEVGATYHLTLNTLLVQLGIPSSGSEQEFVKARNLKKFQFPSKTQHNTAFPQLLVNPLM